MISNALCLTCLKELRTCPIRDDSIGVTLRSVDTLFQVVHRVPRQFLCFRFGTKAIRQEIVSSNPHTELVYSEYVELKRNSRRRR